jgi:uncharacterized phage protein (TIGR01671 family)
MNREIKFEYGFKSVNGIVKKVYYLHEIPNIKEKCDVWNVLPNAYVREYTRLKDKNNKDIYEGDIVLTFTDDKTKAEVIFMGGSFNFCTKNKDGLYFVWKYMKSEIEVIGNIYENPELLQSSSA